MCNAACILFGAKNLTRQEIKGKKVIELGSLDIHGSLRPLIEAYKPFSYIGVDLVKGRGVDVVWDVENLLDRFEKESFDVIISTELIEHVRNWKKVISNMKNMQAKRRYSCHY